MGEVFSHLIKSCSLVGWTVWEIGGVQGRRELGGGPGQIFLGAPILKFSRKTTTSPPPPPVDNFLGKKIYEYVVIAFQRLLTSIFHAKFRYFAQKNKYLALCAEMFHPKKWLGPNKKFLGAPRIFKRAFYKCVGGGTLSWNELADVVLDVVIQLNCRPLSYV
jgi:hypothetical protein